MKKVRSLLPLVVVGVAIIVLSACGGSGGEDLTGPGSVPDPANQTASVTLGSWMEPAEVPKDDHRVELFLTGVNFGGQISMPMKPEGNARAKKSVLYLTTEKKVLNTSARYSVIVSNNALVNPGQAYYNRNKVTGDDLRSLEIEIEACGQKKTLVIDSGIRDVLLATPGVLEIEFRQCVPYWVR